MVKEWPLPSTVKVPNRCLDANIVLQHIDMDKVYQFRKILSSCVSIKHFFLIIMSIHAAFCIVVRTYLGNPFLSPIKG